MISIATLLNKIQQRFTYRQRFLFFAAVFFFTIPLPIYWVLFTQNALIWQKKYQLQGLEKLDTISRILYLKSLLLQERHDSALIEIFDDLAKLKRYGEKPEKYLSIYLGKSFYLATSIKPSIETIHQILEEYVAVTISGKYTEKEKEEINASLLKEIYFLALATGILSDPAHTESNVFYETFFQMPALFLTVQAPIEINALEERRTANMQVIKKKFLQEYEILRVSRYVFVLVFFFVTLAVVLFVIFRVLTKHLLSLLSHIESLAKGNFSTRYYPPSEDEFSQVGLTLNEMAHGLSDISSRIHSLGIVLTASSEHLTYEVMTHETNVIDQESSIQSAEEVVNHIASDCRTYVVIINDLSNSAMQLPLAHNTQFTLASLHKTIEEISLDSKTTLKALLEVQQLLSQANEHSAHMGKISEEAHLLALNASIEANSNIEFHSPFLKITQAIEQFADRTAQATLNIDSILKETSEHIDTAKMTIEECLAQLESGRNSVKEMYNQFQGINQQAVLQMEKFELLNNAMKKQTFEAECIIESLTRVRSNAKKISEVFQQLNVKVQHLGIAARELKQLLEVFFTETAHIERNEGANVS